MKPNILRQFCTDTDCCTELCPSRIALYGFDGNGGRIAAAQIPADYRNVTLQNSPARADQADAYAVLDAYVKTFQRYFGGEAEPIKSVYLYSKSPGTGKTTTAAALLNEFIGRVYLGYLRRNRQAPQLLGYFLDVNAWQTDYNGFNRSHVPREMAEVASERYYGAMASAKAAPMTVLDDIGVRDATEAFRADLHDIINYRVTNRLPTVYTSNIDVDELAKIFDARLADRVRDQCIVLPFGGESKRGLRK